MEEDLELLIKKAAGVLKSFGATEVYLFGSAGNGNFKKEHSDIDLAVRGIPPENFYSAVGETLCSIDRDVDIIDLDADTTFGIFLQDHKELTRVF
jgi:predicted nucleotidyltransferase